MRIILTISMLFVSLVALCDGSACCLSETSLRNLRASNFFTALPIANDADEISVSIEIRKSAEKRLSEIVAPKLFASLGGNPVLSAYPATSTHPDGFAISTEFEGNKLMVFISEFKTDFLVFLATPSRQDTLTTKSAFRYWPERLLKPMWQVEKGQNDLEIQDKGDFILVRKILMDETMKRRFIPWTRAESCKMAFDKNGRWLILSVKDDLPEKCFSQPQGIRERFGGSWFTSSPKNPNQVIRKMSNQQ